MLQAEKEQWNRLKDKPFKEKFSYFWYYYKFHTLGILFAIFCIVMFVIAYKENSKEPSIYVALINSNYMTSVETPLMDDFVKSRNIDTNTNPAKFDISMTMTNGLADDGSVANSQKLMALFNGHDVDVIVADKWVIEEYASLSAFCDLKELLPEELYAQIEDKLFYYTSEDGTTTAIGFYGHSISKLMVNGGYSPENPPIVTIASTTERTDISVDFIRYLLEN
ncbi:MAG: hypothetical protein IJN92_07740 [Lachnospiraceae bacterium]|nr:hypothetical protein [Lachnospiraceae bacterium]